MSTTDDEMADEYDFSGMGTPVRGKHYEKYQKYIRTVELDSKLAERFPDSQSVLAALRLVAGGQSQSHAGS